MTNVSPTVPDDEDGYVPAPGAPSQERPEYEGTPNYSEPSKDPEVGEPMLKRPPEDDVEPEDEAFAQPTVPATDGSDVQIERIESTQGAPLEEGEVKEVEQSAEVTGDEPPATKATGGKTARPSAKNT